MMLSKDVVDTHVGHRGSSLLFFHTERFASRGSSNAAVRLASRGGARVFTNLAFIKHILWILVLDDKGLCQCQAKLYTG